MASISPRNGKYQVRWREGGEERGRSFRAKSDAKIFQREVERRLEFAGFTGFAHGAAPTVEIAAKQWLIAQHGLSENTEALYASLIRNHINPDLGGYKLTELDAVNLEEWQSGRLRKSGPRAVQMARGVLDRILERAVRQQLIFANPLRLVDAPRQKQRQSIEIATVEQVEAMRGLLEGDRTYLPNSATLISVLAYGGLRPPQEPCALMWGDLEGSVLHIRRKNSYGALSTTTKTGRARVVILPDPVAAELKEMQMRKRQRNGLIFPGSDGLEPASKPDWDNWRKRKFKPAAKKVGLSPRFRPYDLRHTCASLMLASGADVAEIAGQLGHTISQCTNTYLHLAPAYAGQPKVSLEDRIREARKPAPTQVSAIHAE